MDCHTAFSDKKELFRLNNLLLDQLDLTIGNLEIPQEICSPPKIKNSINYSKYLKRKAISSIESVPVDGGSNSLKDLSVPGDLKLLQERAKFRFQSKLNAYRKLEPVSEEVEFDNGETDTKTIPGYLSQMDETYIPLIKIVPPKRTSSLNKIVTRQGKESKIKDPRVIVSAESTSSRVIRASEFPLQESSPSIIPPTDQTIQFSNESLHENLPPNVNKLDIDNISTFAENSSIISGTIGENDDRLSEVSIKGNYNEMRDFPITQNDKCNETVNANLIECSSISQDDSQILDSNHEGIYEPLDHAHHSENVILDSITPSTLDDVGSETSPKMHGNSSS